jgi:hypothetical protein
METDTEEAQDPATPERPAGGPDPDNQPPPPPPESDPRQDYEPDDTIERPATNDNDRQVEAPEGSQGGETSPPNSTPPDDDAPSG